MPESAGRVQPTSGRRRGAVSGPYRMCSLTIECVLLPESAARVQPTSGRRRGAVLGPDWRRYRKDSSCAPDTCIERERERETHADMSEA